jgi:hypothetical protein
MLSPGAGLGAQAAAMDKIKKLYEAAIETLNQFPAGSKEQQGLLSVARTLSPFMKEQSAPADGVATGVKAMNAPGAGGPPNLPGGMPPMRPGPEMPMPGGPA